MPIMINLTTADHGGTSMSCGTHESCGIDCNCGCPYTGMEAKGRVELIAEGGLALSHEATAESLMRTIHAHPTLYEALGEAEHAAAEGAAIHI